MEYPISITLYFDSQGNYLSSSITDEYCDDDGQVHTGLSNVDINVDGNIVYGQYRENIRLNVLHDLFIKDTEFQQETLISEYFMIERTYESEEDTSLQERGTIRYKFSTRGINYSENPRYSTFGIQSAYVKARNNYYCLIQCVQNGLEEQDTYTYMGKRDIDDSYSELSSNYVCAISGDGQTKSFSSISFYKRNSSEQKVSTIYNVIISEGASFASCSVGTVDDITTVYIQCQANTSDYNRTAAIQIRDTATGNIITEIQFIQNEADSQDLPVVDEDEYWDNGDVYVCIDDNTGEIIDPTSLLFKGNSNNIYNTLEQKDNTLFLGNYTPVSNIYKIKETIDGLLEGQNLQGEEQMYTPITKFFTTSSGSYNYVPNMNISSQDKRIFKSGETYMMGLVFVTNTGQRSGVYYLGTFSPSRDPYTTLTGYCVKPTWKVEIPQELVTSLYNNGIVGVLPVYAQQNTHNVIAQGFISPTIIGTQRQTQENLAAQYSWYQRFIISNDLYVAQENTDTYSEPLEEHNEGAEIQTTTANGRWKYNTQIFSFNTPEVEVKDELKNSDLSDCFARLVKQSAVESYINNVSVTVNGKYLHSRVRAITWTDTSRLTSINLWYGFQDPGTVDEVEDAQFKINTNNEYYYNKFYVYPWQRSKMGGEGPDSTITNKRFFDTIFLADTQAVPESDTLPDILDACIYKDYQTNSILKVDGDLYQGNVDYILTSDNPYRIFGSDDVASVGSTTKKYPRAYGDSGTFYAGYDTLGKCYDPILMKYKVAPHIVLKFESIYQGDIDDETIRTVQLEHLNYTLDTSDRAKEYSQWIKCGNQIRLFPNSTANVRFEEGDYFYGRFDSLRTYPYTQEDPNSITEILSGMICSRVNLDARTDRNRGITTAIVSPTNFNLFNDVYDQLNNYFTYQFIDETDISTDRNYVNTIQWSLTKTFGSVIDDWCNIQENSSLDLDGDKGELVALKRIGNNLIAFQKTGISSILYNESVQISSTDGLPIELANSGKVNGKRYLYDSIGCQNKQAICTSPSGVYFVDNINKTIYLLGNEGGIADICATGGMKSWALNNINKEEDLDWTCWYDRYTQEVLFIQEEDSLIYDDVGKKFQCFSNYFNIKYSASLGSRTYIFRNTWVNNSKVVELWKKNAVKDSIFFDTRAIMGITVIANPEPTLDKTFVSLEYRADAFNGNTYLADNTFDALQVTNEYQNSGAVSLENIKNRPSNLKKKFRVWRIDMPRSKDSRDRIRNMWCKIRLTHSNTQPDNVSETVNKFIFHDMSVTYFT